MPSIKRDTPTINSNSSTPITKAPLGSDPNSLNSEPENKEPKVLAETLLSKEHAPLKSKESLEETTLDVNEALKLLVSHFEQNGERLLAHIFEQSKVALEGNTITIWLPTGFKNESVEEAQYRVNHFFVETLKREDLLVQYDELKTEFKPDIPYAFQDKVQDMLSKNPDVTLWFEKLKLKQN